MLNDEGVILDDGDGRPARRGRVLRHRHHGQHRGARPVDHVVERRLAAGRPRPERHGRLRGGEPRRPRARASVMARAHRRRRVGRGHAVPVGDARSTSPAFRRSCCGSGSSASSGTRSTSRRRTASTCGTQVMEPPARRTASGRSAWRRSGSSVWRSSTSWSGRTPTPSPIRSRRVSAGWSRRTRTTSSASAALEGLDAEAPGERLVGFTCSGDVGAARGRQRGPRRRLGRVA